MATLPITSGSINLTDVASFFNVSGNTNLADYVRGGDIVPATGAGGDLPFVQFYTSTPHARFGRGFNGADGTTSSTEHTWGIYSNTADLTTNPTGLEPDTTALTVGTSYRLELNVRNEDGTDISADYLTFQPGDRLRFERNTGTFAGNGYLFELDGLSLESNADGQGDQPVVVSMSARVVELVGTGLIDDQLSTSPNRDTLTATRQAIAGEGIYPITNGYAVENLGPQTQNPGNQFSWPTTQARIHGVPDISFIAGGGEGNDSTTLECRFQNNSHTTSYRARRLDIGITFTGTLPGDESIQPQFWFNRGGSTIILPTCLLYTSTLPTICSV